MIRRIIIWLREVWWKMIGRNSIEQKLAVHIAMSEPMMSALELWTKLYENKAPWLTTDVKSLNLAAAIAAEISRTVTIEFGCVVDGSARGEFIQEHIDRVVQNIRGVIEYGSAKGGIVIKPYVQDDGIAFDYIHADQFYPVAFDGNGNIASCIFVDQRVQGSEYLTRLEYHEMSGEGIVIRNKAFRSNTQDMLGREIPLDTIDAWAELEEEAVIQDVDRMLFGYFRPAGANNIDTTSPLGVSCYSRATDLIESADRQWSNLLWEFESGQRALYVDVLAFGRDTDGRVQLPNKRLYRTLQTGSAEGELFEEWSPTLREKNILDGLDAILKKIEFVCGLAYGTISDPNTVDKTATEIKISRQRTYATIVDNQKALQNAFDNLIYAVDVWISLAKLAPQGDYSVTYDFDDSVIVDKDSQFQHDLSLVGAQIMSRLEFRMRNFGEDEKTAQEKLALVGAEQPEDMFGREE